MKATYENCYKVTKKLRRSFSDRALAVVADSVEDLCDMLSRHGVFEFDPEEGVEVDEKVLKAIVMNVSNTYWEAATDAFEVMRNAASELI